MQQRIPMNKNDSYWPYTWVLDRGGLEDPRFTFFICKGHIRNVDVYIIFAFHPISIILTFPKQTHTSAHIFKNGEKPNENSG
jgi:hypothetical protein